MIPINQFLCFWGMMAFNASHTKKHAWWPLVIALYTQFYKRIHHTKKHFIYLNAYINFYEEKYFPLPPNRIMYQVCHTKETYPTLVIVTMTTCRLLNAEDILMSILLLASRKCLRNKKMIMKTTYNHDSNLYKNSSCQITIKYQLNNIIKKKIICVVYIPFYLVFLMFVVR